MDRRESRYTLITLLKVHTVNSRKLKEMTTGELFVPLFTLFTLSLLSKIVCSLCCQQILTKISFVIFNVVV